MRKAPRAAAITLGGALLWGAAGCSGDGVSEPDPDPDPDRELAVEVVAQGIPSPVHLAVPPGDDRLFVVEQQGRIRIIRDGQLLQTPFLDLRAQVSTGGERGLLSLAFHPEYATNGRFFVNYTGAGGATRVERFTVSVDPELADAASGSLVLEVAQPFGNHNGGHIVFGPDGMLYVAMGDGGSGGDPLGHGQDPSTLLGALLRLDVDSGEPYAIPAGNPFVGDPGGRDEIWAIGLRNPWRISFDEPSGTLFVADVGQNRWEEVNAVDAAAAGINYGWNTMEGLECFQAASCNMAGLTLPVITYPTGQVGCAVVGGHVYRGSAIPELAGHYLYSDWCGGWLRSFRLEGGEAVDETTWDAPGLGSVPSFGVGGDGELYVVSTTGGRVYRIVPAG